ncbi:hypothetical protein TRIP_D300186 [uncultured Paludibacter sp.]|uniref:Uncharacterized protein n=1 Tax=uncultured Paludibacter sp. TaxID=497635 RepID=A0A653ABH5_9BACT|nr:hypothetical protein TRIP_D300186 [uncultured Paludibacter sp.]
MTYENFISYIEHPENLAEEQIPELKELIEKFPYFGAAHWLYLKALKNTNSIYYGAELNKTAVFSQERRQLYFFIHPEELETKNNRERVSKDGSYFDMIESFESSDENKRQSLKSLAERLKAARENLKSSENR